MASSPSLPQTRKGNILPPKDPQQSHQRPFLPHKQRLPIRPFHPKPSSTVIPSREDTTPPLLSTLNSSSRTRHHSIKRPLTNISPSPSPSPSSTSSPNRTKPNQTEPNRRESFPGQRLHAGFVEALPEPEDGDTRRCGCSGLVPVVRMDGWMGFGISFGGGAVRARVRAFFAAGIRVAGDDLGF